ncbi:F-box protein [Prunus yedoensis var. nudiflora]|uniref:F-box protein n=1 Tax=Prunus yedoensis var. nudiflora TaxID=2094558 RepID=A0A314YZD5_PRUYE|nr:F-box protein [Prunus yedoensis var. nudiflora]
MFCPRPSFPVYLVLTLLSNELQSPRISSWMASRIPGELLESIGKCLNTRTDVSRFRAVCKSLRSSIPHFEKQLQFPIKVLIRNTNGSNTTFTLTESIVFHLAPPRDDPHKRGWLVKVEEGKYGETRMLHPLSQFVVGRLPHSFPKVFNLLEFRVFEYARVYSIHDGGWWDRNNKVALSMNLGFPAVMIIVDGVLYHGKLDVDVNNCIEISQLDHDQHYDYEDVIFYEGKFYAVGRDGQAVVVDSCLNVKVVAPPILACSGGDHKKSIRVQWEKTVI